MLPVFFTETRRSTPVFFALGVNNFRPVHNLSYYTSILNYFNIFNHWIMFSSLKTSRDLTRYIDRGI